MTPDYPGECRIPALRTLWKEAFGDTDAFLNSFFATAYTSRRCRCICSGDAAAAALYWFDVTCGRQKFAYIYAVATARSSRGKGLCRRLMDDTAALLKARGYDGILLVPQDEGLRQMYGTMGYLPATAITEELCVAGNPVSVKELSPAAFALRRRELLPSGSVLQEGENLSFLSTQARFYAAEDMLAAVSRESEHLRILEYLGDPDNAPALVAALGHREATLRRPGGSLPFSMYLPLSQQCRKPEYFAFCFD